MLTPVTAADPCDRLADFDKANEIYFRLGIIYKQQQKYPASLDCFRYILGHPPRPLTEVDIWFQIGHVHEQQKDYGAAKDAYERVLAENPNHAKVLQQLGWLYHQTQASFANQDLAIQYLTKSLEADATDAQSWYLLGRAFMGSQKYNKAYEAYQQAVYRDGRNPTFWCSIGVLYYQINQYRDALDAYSRAIRLNPFISEVWFDLGSLYESCNNQINDAIDAYARAHDLDPNNASIKSRLNLLKAAQRDGTALPPAPAPQDVHPTAYSSQANGARAFAGAAGQAPQDMPPPSDPSAPSMAGGGRDLAAPPPQPTQNAESAFRGGGGPPPVQLSDDRQAPRRTPLAPMDVQPPPAAVHHTENRRGRPPRESHAQREGLLDHRFERPSPVPSQARARGYDPRMDHSEPPVPPPTIRYDAREEVASVHDVKMENGSRATSPARSVASTNGRKRRRNKNGDSDRSQDYGRPLRKTPEPPRPQQDVEMASRASSAAPSSSRTATLPPTRVIDEGESCC